MSQLEQAVFTSAKTENGEGYHLTARSEGVSEATVRELSRWGPSHNSLLAGSLARSVNFFTLANEGFCVSLTTAGGAEHSGRSGPRVLTRFLIATRSHARKFSNDAFAVLDAAEAIGVFDDPPPIGNLLPRVTLTGGAPPVAEDLVERAVVRFGAERLAGLIDRCAAQPVAVCGAGRDAELLFRAAVSCLPLACRPELTFSTGLKFSARRPFRLLAAPQQRGPQRRRWETTTGMCFWDVGAGEAPLSFTPGGWAAQVAELLDNGRVPQLVRCVSNPGTASTFAELGGSLGPTPGVPSGSPGNRRAHAAHRGPAHTADTPPATQIIDRPSQHVSTDAPEILERLGLLDDALFEAISGQPAAVERLRSLWPELTSNLAPALLAESKEHYLRYALNLWQEHARNSRRDPSRAVALLDILGMLFGEA